MKIKPLIILFLFTAVSTTFGNQIHYKPIELADLVRASDLILVVKKADPFTVRRELPIQCSNGKKASVYYQTLFQFVVIDELKNTTGTGHTGKTIQVHHADEESDIYLHTKYDCEGVAKSPIYQRYYTEFRIDKAEKAVIFLQNKNGVFYYTAAGSEESASVKEKILSIIKKDTP